MFLDITVGTALPKWILSLKLNPQVDLISMKAPAILLSYVSPIFYSKRTGINAITIDWNV